MFQVSPMNWIIYLMFFLYFFMYMFQFLKKENLYLINKNMMKIYVK